MKNLTQLNGEPGLISGFTLVELAIVLVIIGLLVGGVLAGQELVKQAQIRRNVTEISNYLISITTFQAKFNKIPGDFDKAKLFLPNCNEAIADACNGNGDGIINGDTNRIEAFLVFRHMSLANLLKNNYNISAAPNYVGGVDNPFFLIPDSGKSVINPINTQGDPDGFYNGLQGNALSFSALSDPINCDSVYQIDAKLDDGRYNGGIMRIYTEEGDDCSNITGSDGSYNVTNSGIATYVIKIP